MMKKPEVVVITGASAGVGRATAREFARCGAHGSFDESASDTSQQLWATTRRGLFLLALAGAGALLCAAAAKLLLSLREQRLRDTQLERFRESGVM
ncbi:MAG: short chain dehydrogenase [Acidobacteriota bacterium]|jgi:NAD(P)-dependent dehydrogenase (short-subunit alcohol dehydrogenase family)|nr:short chain dehydrogenase [Acidobacteriota bacterium]